MPEMKPPVLTDTAKEALNVLRDARFEEGGLLRDDVVLGICALFHEPLTLDKSQVISSLSPISRNPRLAIETFLKGAQALEAVLKPHDDVVKTSFGPMSGMSQQAAQQKLRDSLAILKVEAQAKFGAQFDEVERYQAANRAQRG